MNFHATEEYFLRHSTKGGHRVRLAEDLLFSGVIIVQLLVFIMIGMDYDTRCTDRVCIKDLATVGTMKLTCGCSKIATVVSF